jgi:hypothetical protein
MTHRQLGIAYLKLRGGDYKENLKRSIRHYEAALRVTSESNSPVDWAEIQNNLGIALAALPTAGPEERAENLQRAIVRFQEALRVRTFKQWPVEWARLQRNLASAFVDLPSGDPIANIERGIEYHDAAMRIR